MRTIKFRAWDKRNSKMVDHAYLEHHRSGFRLFDKEDWGNEFELMQFTGLLDRRGKEIWEGDLLKISMQGDEQTNPFQVENLWDLRIGMENNDAYMRIDNDVEVIGNIYENSNLLTK